MFSGLAGRYSVFNRWASLGLDGVWRKSLLREVSESQNVLDLGTGPGDLAWGLTSSVCSVVGMDISFSMIEKARKRVPFPPHWLVGSAENLPFKEKAFDAVVSAFVVRNLYRTGILEKALSESARVLKPQGKLVFLDLTKPRNPFVGFAHKSYNRFVLPRIGRFFFGNKWPGDYLASSIEDLPEANEMKDRLIRAGFQQVFVRPLWGGIVSLFVGRV